MNNNNSDMNEYWMNLHANHAPEISRSNRIELTGNKTGRRFAPRSVRYVRQAGRSSAHKQTDRQTDKSRVNKSVPRRIQTDDEYKFGAAEKTRLEREREMHFLSLTSAASFLSFFLFHVYLCPRRRSKANQQYFTLYTLKNY